jgi:hypothetical protein
MSIVESPGSLPERPAPVRRRSLRVVLSWAQVNLPAAERAGLTSDDLFRLTAIPGKRGTEPSTRNEIICALKVMAVDGAFVDTRFEPGGEFSDFRFTATAAATKVERWVRDRFLALATANGDHFVAPGRPDTAPDHTGPRHPIRLSIPGLSPPARGGPGRGLPTGPLPG